MEQVTWRILIAISIPLYALATNNQAQAQISSDGTLSTQVSQSGNIFEITGGVQADRNLFHSFKEFSVHFGSEAFFKNSTNANIISNIISRVTGGSPSNIDGLIRENYGANFILINPWGINFGANAQLQIGGSFLASTASSLKFADGKEFSAIAPQSSSSLTVSVPVGLQFGQNQAAIRVQGSGHRLTVRDPIFSPITPNSNSTGLQVRSGQTLALVGGDLILEGGTLTAEAGRIELGSVAQGLVGIKTLPQGWTFSYSDVPNFQDIELRSRALVDASGASGGSIRVQGRNLSLQEGSLILIQNQGLQPAGAIKVKASESVTVSGTNADGTIRSSLTNETVGTGGGGDLVISTRKLAVGDGATIVAKTFSPATGGNVHVNASESVQVTGASAINPSVTSSIVAASFGPGDSGHNEVSTGRLLTREGGTVAAATFGTGQGGNLTIKATDLVEIVGGEPNSLLPSGAITSTFNAGDAGNLIINTPRLFVRDGGGVIASTLASGSAGNITINAPELVEVKGTAPGSAIPSLIASSANLVNPSLQQIFGLPPVPSGASGNLTINTGQLSVTDGALITARNDGSGISGNIRVSAGSILLDNEGGITATTESGGSGNINLQVQDSLHLQGNSQISANQSGTGNAGDINITAGSVSLTEDSDLESEVKEGGVGKAGNINISARSVSVLNDSDLITDNRGKGDAGDINITASEDVVFDGEGDANSRVRGGVGNAGDINITAQSVTVSNNSELESDNRDGVGNAGDINITAQSVTVSNGSDLRAETESQGNAGNINITATDTVIFDNNGDAESRVREGGVGQGGNINITTGSLYVTRGGNLRASSFGVGNAGDIAIAATDEVVLDGSGINSDGELTFSAVLSTVDSKAVGNAGNVRIRARSLSVTNGAQASVSSLGFGDAGTLEVNAGSIFLDNEGAISAELGGFGFFPGGQIPSPLPPQTVGVRQGGGIEIATQQLVVRGGARISTATFTKATGGNITINANALVLLESSDIIANAIRGRGGNIEIDTQGLFRCEDCQISASSNLGLDGVVEISTLDPDTSLEVLDVPEQLAKPEDVVALACSATQGQAKNEFTITGRGGLPPRPSEALSSEALVSFESPEPSAGSPSHSGGTLEEPEASDLPPPAQGWYVSDRGTVVLATQVPTATPHDSGLTSANCHAH